jgi:uncharacterized iron-regulated membrane protein
MTTYKVFWEVHKWLGIVLAAILINISVTGFLLLEKKQYEWLQPATRKGLEGTVDKYISMEKLFDAVYGCNHPDFVNFESIDRVDFRPSKNVYKVRSKTNHAEIQVCAVSGKILNTDVRRSDFLEGLHDGSYFGEWMHGKVMPAFAISNVILAVSGLYLWLGPKLKRKKKSHRI